MVVGIMNRRFSLYLAAIAGVVLCASVHAATPWSPAETNTWGWWDPSDAATMTTNASGGVLTLSDLSGHGITMSSAAGREPASFTRLLGTNYGLDFVSAELDRLQFGSSGWAGLGSNGVVSIYAVADPDGSSLIIANFQDDCHFSSSSINPYGKRTPSNGSLSYTGGPHTNASIFSTHLVFDVSTNLPLSYFNAYVNGTKVTTDKAYVSQVPVDHTSRFTFLTGNNNDITEDGGLGEVVITYDASDSGRETIEGYLAWKWGLQSLLPENHPYEKRAPGLGAPGTVIVLE